ncbi:MAG: M28 family peptidase [Planctomycetota bacterium]
MILNVLLPVAALLVAASAAPPVDDEPLERALDSITAEKIRSDLEFIASDEMAGRDSPSPELKIAARYIRARLMRLGFEPGARGESYLDEWRHALWGHDETRTWLQITGKDGLSMSPTWGEGYFLPKDAFGVREVSGKALWAGTFDAKKLDKLKVRGRWVVGQPKKGISGKRLTQLEKNGAVGVVVLPKAKRREPVAKTFESTLSDFRGTSLKGLRGGTPRGDGFPVVHLNEALGKRLLGAIDDPDVGDDLGMEISESCGYGRLDDAVLENVIGIWPGSDARLKKEVIILSAHYDHVGEGPDGAVFNGADDNGSGTCGLMAIAEALAEYGPMRRTVMLMWVSAEERGLLGSAAWTKNPYLPKGMKPLCNINIDMIGRNKKDEFLITPTKSHPAYSALTKVAEANAKKEGFRKIKSADSYWKRSDHANFSENLGIPVAFLFCDVHEDYHETTDTTEKIDFDKMRRICRLVVRMLEALQIDEPKF